MRDEKRKEGCEEAGNLCVTLSRVAPTLGMVRLHVSSQVPLKGSRLSVVSFTAISFYHHRGVCFDFLLYVPRYLDSSQTETKLHCGGCGDEVVRDYLSREANPS